MSATGVGTMAKAMSKEAQLAALRETNGQLEADVTALSEAVGELEAEIVTERATAARLVAEAQQKVVEALARTAGDAAVGLAAELEDLRRQLETRGAETAKLKEALGWAERSRDEAEAEMDRQCGELRQRAETAEDHADNLMEAHKEELDALREKLEAENQDAIKEVEQAAQDEAENLRAALDGYLADLGYPRDPHPSTITCPSLRRLVTEIN